jgi:hypothetical protein
MLAMSVTMEPQAGGAVPLAYTPRSTRVPAEISSTRQSLYSRLLTTAQLLLLLLSLTLTAKEVTDQGPVAIEGARRCRAS